MIARHLHRRFFFIFWLIGSGSALVFGQGGNPATLSEYIYAVPPGWTSNQYPDGIVLTSPASVTGERCQLSMWPMRSAGTNLQADANYLFRDIFKTYEPRNQTSRGTALPSSVVRGTSGQGWDYLIVKRGIGKPSNPPGMYASLLGFVMVARLGNYLGVISGLGKDPLVSTCLGELAGNAWPRFFHSLKFRSWKAPAEVPEVRQKLVGVWTTATAYASDQFTFAANGRYGGAAAAQQYNRVSNTQVLQTTQAYFGNGAYTLRENTITLTPDDQKNNPETGYFRLEEESKDEGRTWAESLYLLRVSRVDGKDYEVRYTKR
jgi:hypothetical protein